MPVERTILILTVVLGSTLDPGLVAAEESGEATALLASARAAYQRRHLPAQDVLAVKLYEQTIAAQATYEALWEGARACSHLGQNAWEKASRQKRQDLYRKGRDWAERATKVNPQGAQGHFYLAVLTGLDAQERTFLHQMGQAANIRRAAERALKLDPSVECGGPPRLLGMYYRALPSAFGGDNSRALKFFVQALRFCPNDAELYYSLAECHHTLGNDTKARDAAQWVIEHAPTAPDDQRSYQQIKQQTLELIRELD